MGIDLNHQTEKGELLEQVADPTGAFSRLIQNLDDPSSICLRYLDPYGDTTFNQNQLPTLIAELRALLSKAGHATGVVAAMITLAEKAKGQTHTYLCFAGD